MDHDEVNRNAMGADVIVVGAAAVELADVEVFCLAMATDENGERFGLSFQVPISGDYDEQDQRLGMNTYSISDHMGRTLYGGILAWSADATESVLTIEFSPSVADTLDMPMSLRFHVPPKKFREIVSGFRRILAGEKRGIEMPMERALP
jgi:Immunity protein 10